MQMVMKIIQKILLCSLLCRGLWKKSTPGSDHALLALYCELASLTFTHILDFRTLSQAVASLGSSDQELHGSLVLFLAVLLQNKHSGLCCKCQNSPHYHTAIFSIDFRAISCPTLSKYSKTKTSLYLVILQLLNKPSIASKLQRHSEEFHLFCQ